MSRSKTVTLLIAIGVGIASALMLRPMWLEHRALMAISSPEEPDRERGWRWLQGPADPDRERRAESRLKAISGRLAVAGDPALRHGADALRRIDLWSWSRQPITLWLRELDVRAVSPDPEVQRTAADDLGEAPPDIPTGRIVSVADALLASEAADVRRAGLEHAIAWLGPDRAGRLDELTIDDPALDRLRHLALLGAPLPPESAASARAPQEVIEAKLLRRTFAEPGDASAVLSRLDSQPVADPFALDYLLRHSRDPRARRALETRAESGVRGAQFALHARSESVDERQARLIVGDRAQPAPTRRVAAWRWRGISESQVQPVLALPPADEDGSVYAAALLAERCLSPDAARIRAEAWIRSFDDDEKRAGALLAALLGGPHELLAEAYELEDIPEVRTTQRLALWAMGHPVGPDDAREFAHRSLHRGDGDFGAGYRALCMLRAGERDALANVTGRPLATRWSVQQRAWLIERFVPHWHERLGRPIGGNLRAIDLHFDALNAAYHVERRHLVFDPDTQTFTPGERTALTAAAVVAMITSMTAGLEYTTALRVVTLPRDTNAYGTIFGGVILSYIDQAGFIEARKHGHHRWVTVSVDRVDFHAPVMVGDVVAFLTATERTGTTSARVRIRVEAERYATRDTVRVTEAQLTMVSVNAVGKPIPFRSPPTIGEPAFEAGT